jgi:antitoxin (DNA-binding transcriptional repressor) of toxin-antitoxin stability system
LIDFNQNSLMTIINRVPITKARINLGQIARRAHNGNEYFILEKDGIPVIGIMAAAELEAYLEKNDPAVKTAIAASREEQTVRKPRAPRPAAPAKDEASTD